MFHTLIYIIAIKYFIYTVLKSYSKKRKSSSDLPRSIRRYNRELKHRRF